MTHCRVRRIDFSERAAETAATWKLYGGTAVRSVMAGLFFIFLPKKVNRVDNALLIRHFVLFVSSIRPRRDFT